MKTSKLLIGMLIVGVSLISHGANISGTKDVVPAAPNVYYLTDTINYYMTLSNTHPTENIVITLVTDTLPDGTVETLNSTYNATYPDFPFDLPAGAAQIYEISWPITGVSAGSINNRFRFVGYQESTVQDNFDLFVDKGSLIIDPDTEVGITVTDPTGLPGRPTNLIITEKNTGEDPLTNVFVDVWADEGSGDVLLATLGYPLNPPDSGDAVNPQVLDEGAPPPNGEMWSWNIGPFTVNNFTTYTVKGYGLDLAGNTVSFDMGYTNEKAQATADIDVNPGLTILKTGPAYSKHEGPWGAGDTITYEVTITIGGDWPLILDTLVDDKAGDQSSLLPAGPQSVGTVIGPLFYKYDPLPSDPDPLVNVVTVTAHAEGFPAETASAKDDHTVVLLHPTFTVTKQCTQEPVKVGDSAIFDVEIINTSPDTDLVIDTDEDVWPDEPFDLPQGASRKTTVSILVTEGMTEVYNKVTVTATLNARYELDNIIKDDDDDTCDVAGGATRTPGFWQTHTDYTTHIFEVHCGSSINLGWKVLETPEDVFGMFWANNAWNSDGTRRTKRCQAQVTVSFHALAAILNSCLDNGAPLPVPLAEIIDTLQNGTIAEIRALGVILGAYNESGDDETIVDSDGFLIGNADPNAAKATANYAIADCDSTGKTKGNNK